MIKGSVTGEEALRNAQENFRELGGSLCNLEVTTSRATEATNQLQKEMDDWLKGKTTIQKWWKFWKFNKARNLL